MPAALMHVERLARGLATTAVLVGLLLAGPAAPAAGPADSLPPPPALAVQGALPPPPSGVADLRFGEMFRRPVGPRGLEPSDRLLALAGRTVRLVGYMAAAELPMAGRLILSPLPTQLGDEDEHLADDLPPQAVFVHLSGDAAARTLPHYRGLITLQGRLAVGPLEEPDGHVSSVRLLLDDAASRACLPPP